jgi:2'-5' RNA ligase
VSDAQQRPKGATRLRGKPLRLFVAAYPPRDEVERIIAAAHAALAVDDAPMTADMLRWTPAGQVHLTLQFIGTRHPRELDSIVESIERSASGLGNSWCELGSLLCLPERGPPRVLAAEVTASGEVIELKRRLARRLAKPVKGKSHDPAAGFRPHVSLARVRKDLDLTHPRPGRFAKLAPLIDSPPARWSIARIFLMRSTLTAAGAKHDEVHRFTLS